MRSSRRCKVPCAGAGWAPSVCLWQKQGEIILQLIGLLCGCSYCSSPVISLGFRTALGILDWFCENCALLGLWACGWVRQCLPNSSAAETAQFPAETMTRCLQQQCLTASRNHALFPTLLLLSGTHSLPVVTCKKQWPLASRSPAPEPSLLLPVPGALPLCNPR